ncbi:MAG TPA: type ISP restriction/modification enzyme [Candidatus Saccharimonadales bacterium]|nr:type ISP restriction/modification enzyme [Candidatus Saccharimonadales bacterium]
MTDADFFHEEPAAYGSSGKPAPLTDYLRKLEQALKRGDATEHTHRPALKALIEALDEKVVVTNEPKRSECGAPDYVVSRRRDQLTLGYVEAKSIGSDLAEMERGEQLQRYLPALPNLLLTDYVEFRWFVNGKKRDTFRLGRVLPGGKLAPLEADELDRARRLLLGFLSQKPVDIASAEDLARKLASLAHLIRNVIIGAFQSGHASQQLRDWRAAFAATLLPELAPHGDPRKEAEAVSEFADMFAQTLAYGLFSARAASGSSEFTREKAQKLIPRTNPFLRTFFEQITGATLEDEPFASFVEDLIQTLNHADMARVMEDFGKHGRRRDPVIHFYETFLQAYDPKLREVRGVYYTPEPVVNYIVQSIDRLLKNKFGIKAGLADHQKIPVKRTEGEREITDQAHRVLILDPAAGTATFLYTVLDFIRSQFKSRKNAGQWSSYVHEHLLPRLFGFELLMAPYAVAHFKIGLALAAMDEEPLFRQQWSYEPQGNERVNIFLTNTLEDLEHTAEQLGPLRALSDEANSAYQVKAHKPVLVVLGNPPYANFGQQNRHPWILGLLEDYKRGLNEKKLNLNDDFIKFIRWAQWRIERTGSGIIGYITNNVYLDGLTHRRMRECLLETFDEIYIVNLHGSSKKQETAPGGSHDDNVFDITVGVAIVLFVKLPPGAKKGGKSPASVRYVDLWGRRGGKYQWLDDHHSENTKWQKLRPEAPGFYLVPRDASLEKEFRTLWSVRDLFPVSGNAIKTERDRLTIQFSEAEIKRVVGDFKMEAVEELRMKFELGPDSRDWSIARAQADVQENAKEQFTYPVVYRPFDVRYTWYSGRGKGFIGTPASSLMHHMLEGDNLGLCCLRQARRAQIDGFFAVKNLVGKDVVSPFDIGTVFPLYLYPNGNLPEEDLFAHDNGRRPNLSAAFIEDFCEKLKVKFVPNGLGRPGKRELGPELIFHYAYAVFHSPAYRERYAEFLRADFPRLPMTTDFELFRELAGFGGELVNLHARGKGDPRGISFPVKGDNIIEQVRYQPPQGEEPGRVWINDRQHFAGVPETAWTFPIGGYLPAQRWLKDRVGRALGYEEQSEYQRIIWALIQTRRLMGEIDASINQHGGWPMT